MMKINLITYSLGRRINCTGDAHVYVPYTNVLQSACFVVSHEQTDQFFSIFNAKSRFSNA
jgi:hypothetical protein